MSMNVQDKLKFYVLNYDFNKKKVVHFNIFNNINVYEATLELINDYNDKKYSFDEFVNELLKIVQWQEWGRRQYEISVGDAFETDLNKFEKWDCFEQFRPNARMFAHYLLDT